MYCPKCAAQIDGDKFCRQCGTNVSLIPQALTGQLPVPESTVPVPPAPQTVGMQYGRKGKMRKQPKPPSIDGVMNELLSGLGFLVGAFAVRSFMPGGKGWWFWMLFPAVFSIWHGISEYVQLRVAQQQVLPPASMQSPVAIPPVATPVATPVSTPVPTTSELKLPAAAQPVEQPASIVEHTTALLDPARQKTPERQ